MNKLFIPIFAYFSEFFWFFFVYTRIYLLVVRTILIGRAVIFGVFSLVVCRYPTAFLAVVAVKKTTDSGVETDYFWYYVAGAVIVVAVVAIIVLAANTSSAPADGAHSAPADGAHSAPADPVCDHRIRVEDFRPKATARTFKETVEDSIVMYLGEHNYGLVMNRNVARHPSDEITHFFVGCNWISREQSSFTKIFSRDISKELYVYFDGAYEAIIKVLSNPHFPKSFEKSPNVDIVSGIISTSKNSALARQRFEGIHIFFNTKVPEGEHWLDVSEVIRIVVDFLHP